MRLPLGLTGKTFLRPALGFAAACALTAQAAPQEPEFSLAQKEKAGTI